MSLKGMMSLKGFDMLLRDLLRVSIAESVPNDAQLTRDVQEFILSSRATVNSSQGGAVSLCERASADGGLSEP